MLETDYPHLTVAAVCEKEGKFLFVREQSETGLVINQPAGHVEPNESILDAVVRETYEETGWKVRPESFLGLSQYKAPANGVSYVRLSFVVSAQKYHPEVELDDGIEEALWLSYEEASKMRVRSPLVVHSLRLYQQNVRYPLTLLHHQIQ